MGDENGTDLQLDTSDDIEEEVFEENWGSLQAENDLEEAKENSPHDADASEAGEGESVVDFLRSFLSQMRMTDTLDCLQAEWHDLAQKGVIDSKQVEMMPQVHIQNRDLESELENAKRERDEYKRAISAAEETVVKMQKDRDFHWRRHKRLIQEKDKLVQDTRKLTHECSQYIPKIKRMDEKYQKLLQQTMNATGGRDRKPQLDPASE